MSKEALRRSVYHGDVCGCCGRQHEPGSEVVVLEPSSRQGRGTYRRHNYCLACWGERLKELLGALRGREFITDLACWRGYGADLQTVSGVCPVCQKRVLLPHNRPPRDLRPFSLVCSYGCRNRRAYLRKKQRSEQARQGRTCPVCGTTFTPKNTLGKTCSGACRVRLHRQQKKDSA